jgi:lysozyme-like protein
MLFRQGERAVLMVAVLIGVGVIAVILYFSQSSQASEGNMTAVKDTYSYDELVQLATDAGFGADAQMAAAVAMAESGGNRMAYNPESQVCTPEGFGSYGLWQIYLFKHQEYNCEDLYQPDINAKAAFAVYSQARGFSPWSTFKNGAYQKFMA